MRVRKVSISSIRFNSRTPGGVRQPNNDMIMRAERFNSRTPGGVRPLYTEGSIY